MKKIRKEPPRHFPYQHPTFGTDKRPKASFYWKETVYYFWWEYLRRNDEYLKTCENNGAGKHADLYKDFGDVRDSDFKVWWNQENRGALLFSNPVTEDQVTELIDGEKAFVDEERLVVSIPLNLPQKFLIQKIRKIIEAKHKGNKGRQYAKNSKATYRFKGQPNIKALRIGLEVYDQIKTNPKKHLWEIAMLLPQFQMELEDYKNGVIPEFTQRRVMSSTVSRYKKRVLNAIKNAASKNFP